MSRMGKRAKVIHIDAAELGPRNAKKGERMTAEYGREGSVTLLYEHDGSRWVQIATFRRGDYPKCWTLTDGTRQADHP